MMIAPNDEMPWLTFGFKPFEELTCKNIVAAYASMISNETFAIYTPTKFFPKFRRRLGLRGFYNLNRSPVKIQ
jgi:hypothetical protein